MNSKTFMLIAVLALVLSLYQPAAQGMVKLHTTLPSVALEVNEYAGCFILNAPKINGAVIINSTGHEFLNVSIKRIPGGIPNWKYPLTDCGVFSVDYLSNGHFLLQVGYNKRPGCGTSGIWNSTTGAFVYPVRPGCIVELDAENNLVWSFVSDSDMQWPHDVERLPNGNTLVANAMGSAEGNGSDGRVIEVNSEGQIVWDWNPREWIRYPNWTQWEIYQGTPSSGQEARWTHINDADRLPNGNTMINLRHLNMTVIVDPTGMPVWLFGPEHAWINASGKIDWDWGGSTPYYQHDPVMLRNGNVVVSDSGNMRAFEINGTTKQIVWQYNVTQHKFPSSKVQDSDRLPNGNTLLLDSVNSWVWEVTPEGDTVWEVNATKWKGPAGAIFDIDYIPNYSEHSVSIVSPIAGHTYESSSIPIELWYRPVEGAEFTSLAYRIYSNSTGNWIDAENQSWTVMVSRTLQDGNYTVYVYAAEMASAVTAFFSVRTGTTLDPVVVGIVVIGVAAILVIALALKRRK